MNQAVDKITFLFLFTFTLGFSQTYDDDARFWLNLKFNKKLGTNWSANLTLQNRFHNNVTEYSRCFADLGLEYKINKHVRVLADYVYGGKRRLNGTYSHVHQAYAGILLRQKYQRFLFQYRNIVQLNMEDVYSSEDGRQLRFFERNKLTVKYEWNKRLDVYLAGEINSPFYRFSDLMVRRTRLVAGLEYQLSDKSGVEAGFIFQNRYRYSSPSSREFIYTLSYSYNF